MPRNQKHTHVNSKRAQLRQAALERSHLKSPQIEPHNSKAFVRMLPVGTVVSFSGHLILTEQDVGTVVSWARDRVTVKLTQSDWIAAGCQTVDVIPERLKTHEKAKTVANSTIRNRAGLRPGF